MANKILTDEGWQQRIRDKLGTHDANLPDSVIESPDHITIAEINIIKAQPKYTELTENDLIYLQAATVCECARLICPTMKVRLPVSEGSSNYKSELEVDWDKRAEDLAIERDSNLGNISLEDAQVFYGFDLSGRK